MRAYGPYLSSGAVRRLALPVSVNSSKIVADSASIMVLVIASYGYSGKLISSISQNCPSVCKLCWKLFETSLSAFRVASERTAILNGLSDRS